MKRGVPSAVPAKTHTCTEKFETAISDAKIEDVYKNLGGATHSFWVNLISGGVTLALGASTGTSSAAVSVDAWRPPSYR